MFCEFELYQLYCKRHLSHRYATDLISSRHAICLLLYLTPCALLIVLIYLFLGLRLPFSNVRHLLSWVHLLGVPCSLPQITPMAKHSWACPLPQCLLQHWLTCFYQPYSSTSASQSINCCPSPYHNIQMVLKIFAILNLMKGCFSLLMLSVVTSLFCFNFYCGCKIWLK